MTTYKPFVKELRKLFTELVPSYIGKSHDRAGTKIKNDGTPVDNLDYYTLNCLRDFISKSFPGDYAIGEEDKIDEAQIIEILQKKDQLQWAIDGLDGTGNYGMKTTSYGAMISLRRGDTILLAIIFRPIDEKLRGDGFYYAENQKGAWQYCRDHGKFHRLHTVSEGALKRTLVMLEGSSKKFFRPPISQLGNSVTTRPSFSTCIAATTVAQGQASALVTAENKPWDNWPSILLIKEAGGIVTDWYGNSCVPQNCGNIIAAANETDSAYILKIMNTK